MYNFEENNDQYDIMTLLGNNDQYDITTLLEKHKPLKMMCKHIVIGIIVRHIALYLHCVTTLLYRSIFQYEQSSTFQSTYIPREGECLEN